MIKITHIDDVRPHLVDGFVEMDKGDYIVVDYVHIGAGFDSHPVLNECRGLIFDKSGLLIRRPLHKFFNLGEKGVTEESIDWTRSHIVLDKLDGSMIAPFILNGQVRFGTRAGITDHSLRCEAKHLWADSYRQMALKNICESGWTLIFEWTSPENQIILQYPDDKITLLAVRNNETGEYRPRSWLKICAQNLAVPLVEDVGYHRRISDIYKIEGAEGVVIWFTDDDYFVKVKTDEYVRSHRAVSYFEREDFILEAVLNNSTDDIESVLNDEQSKRLRDYYNNVWQEVDELSARLQAIVTASNGMNRKTFAIEIAGQARKEIRGAYFSILDGKNPVDVVKERFIKCPELLQTRWNKKELVCSI